MSISRSASGQAIALSTLAETPPAPHASTASAANHAVNNVANHAATSTSVNTDISNDAPAPETEATASPSRNFLARQRQRLKPNGTVVSGPANLITVTKSANGGRPFSTMRDGAARPRYSDPEAITPQLCLGGKNTAGRHARDAAEIAAEQLLGSADTVAMPLPKLSPHATLPDDVSDAGTLSEKMGSEAEFDREAQRLFPVVLGENGAQEALAARTALLGLIKGTATDAQARLAGPFEPPIMLLYALAAVTPGQPALALRVLQRLGQGLQLPQPGAAAPAQAAGGVDDLAWRAAQALAVAGGAALDALKALTPPLAWREAQSLQMFLETGAALRALPGAGADARPHAVATLGAADSIARLAMGAALKLARGTQPEQLGEAEKAAHFNWRHNLREAGPNGDLALAQARLDKSVTWFNRAEERAHSPWFDVMRLLGKHKTPIASLKHGTLGAHLDTDAKENAKFDAGLDLAISGLQQALEVQLASTADGAGAARLALTVAKLHHWRAQLDAPQADGVALAPEAASLGPADAAAIAGAARRLLGPRKPLAQHVLRSQRDALHPLAAAVAHLPGPIGPLSARALQLRHAAAQADLGGEACTMETLQKWAAQLEPDGQLESAYQAGIGAAQAALANLEWKPADMAPATIGAFLAEYLQVSPMGNRLRLFDGAAHGINNTAFPGLPVAPDARSVRLNQAVVEANSHGAAIELAFGKQVLGRHHGGVSHSFGLANEGPLQLGVSVGGNTGADIGHFEGVRLRFLRELDENQVGTNVHKERIAAFVEDMQQAAIDARTTPRTAQQTWQRLLVDRQFDANMSVSWQHHPQQTSKVTAYARGGASLGGEALDGAFVGASVQVGVEVNPSIGLNRSERSGRLSRTVVQMGYAYRATGRAGVGVSPPDGPAPNLLAISTTFAGSSVLAATRAFEHAGRLKSDFVYRDVESEAPAAYQERMEENRPIWEPALGAGNLDARLAETAANFRPNQRPAERWRVMESGARRYDAVKSALRLREAALAQEMRPQARAALAGECAALTAEGKEVFANLGRWWEPVGTWNLEVNTKAKSPGLNLFAQLTIESGVSTDRELSWIGSSTAQMNAASNAFRAAPGAAVAATAAPPVAAAPGSAKDTG